MRHTIRAFEPGDQDAVTALALRAWAPVFASLEQALGSLFAVMHQDWRADQRQAVEAACQDENLTVWVAEADSSVSGFAAARLDHDERIGEIHMIAVDPDHQRAGVASALTEHAVRWFTGHGMTLAMVETGGDPGHAPARRTYERNGFTPLPIARYFREL
ncbi:GNAT family N-acetyltransferase [Amycolatopsis magusensis]|uniref:GNAT superfamily N-acetyltransferase n=1 Tax=Amycolatopsis magusensis TaxID=882444 RepID=A0ABS4PV35_9PSEU|nr:GNAT family N-acetyltransferase [Amycolatopsis magusensis]MBP2183297.1 GNAT superfamily N-acetyltransferase [Amycolatopsis magusensis]